jgi:hypothetical protein
MRKLTVLSTILFFLAVSSFADEEAISTSGKRFLIKDNGTWAALAPASASTKDFRNCLWGMTKKAVIKAEGITESALAYNDDNMMASSSTIAGLSCNIIYIFAYDKLVRAKYYITESHTNNNIFIEQDYPKLKTLLSSKYGQPIDEGTDWSNDLYKDDPQDWGTALAYGHLSFHTQWETEATSIYLYLSGDNFKVTFGIEYTSKEWGNLEKKQQDEETSSKL